MNDLNLKAVLKQHLNSKVSRKRVTFRQTGPSTAIILNLRKKRQGNGSKMRTQRREAKHYVRIPLIKQLLKNQKQLTAAILQHVSIN